MDQRDNDTRELLSAYLDNELSPDERIAVERLLSRDADSRRWLHEIRAAAESVAMLPRFRLDAGFAERVMAAASESIHTSAEGQRPGPAAPAQPDTVRRPMGTRRRAMVGWWVAAAACLAVCGFLSLRAGHRTAAPLRPLAAVPGSADRQGRDARETLEPTAEVVGARSGSRAPAESMARLQVREPGAATPAVPGRFSPGSPSPAEFAASPPDSAPAVAAPAERQGPAPAENMAAGPVAGQSLGARVSRAPGSRPAASPDPVESGRLEPDWVTKVPASPALQLLLVVDVTLSPQGETCHVLETTLAQCGIALEETAVVDAALEESLLASRFFDPREAPSDSDSTPGMTLLYVQGVGHQMDSIWRTLRSRPEDCRALDLDVAILSDDLAMFHNLRRVIQHASGQGAGRAADSRAQQRRAAAHRLVLSPQWRGTPAQKLRGVPGLAGLVPDWMLGDAAEPTARARGVPGQPAPRMPLQPTQQLGENLDVEALFVVH